MRPGRHHHSLFFLASPISSSKASSFPLRLSLSASRSATRAAAALALALSDTFSSTRRAYSLACCSVCLRNAASASAEEAEDSLSGGAAASFLPAASPSFCGGRNISAQLRQDPCEPLTPPTSLSPTCFSILATISA
eukprot:COSAG01_NODE_5885_length_3970_cov_16.893051_2_plen_137_part_00